MAEPWREIARHKQAERDALIPTEWRLSTLPLPQQTRLVDIPRESGILSEYELEITEQYDATALAEAIASRKLSCIDVTTAFCKRAAIAQQLTNCLTEIHFEAALSRAKALDHHLERGRAPLGPFHGVPISLKDSFRIPGLDSTVGLAALANKPSTFTSPLVSILLSAGAVIYCKTNVPQTMMALDSDNNVWGRTRNPLNTKVTPGGSSGGEGALGAMKGSVLGVGTDIGGSIRIPAMCNGLFGLMPSANRLPYAGLEEGHLPGRSALGLQSRAGPMARSVRDCELFMRAIAAAKPWKVDPALVPGFYEGMDMSVRNSQMSSQRPKGLVIGVMSTDNVTTPLPAIRQLLAEVTTALNAAGHTVIPLPTPPTFSKIQSLTNAFFSLDGGAPMLNTLRSTSEPLIPWLSGKVKEKPPKTLDETRQLHAQRIAIRTELLQKLWRAPAPDGREIDAIVCPVAPHPVPRNDRWGGVGYTSSFVFLDYCAGVVPVRTFTEADANLEFLENEKEVLGSWDRGNRALWEEKERSTYVGTPLCVQVVAPTLQERRLVRAMGAVDAAVRGVPWEEEGASVDARAADAMGGMAGAKL